MIFFQILFGYDWESGCGYFPRRPKKFSAGCAVVFLRGFIKRLSADHGGITAGFLRAFRRISDRGSVLFPDFPFS